MITKKSRDPDRGSFFLEEKPSIDYQSFSPYIRRWPEICL